AEYIAESIKGEGADVVGLQEVWDVALAAAIIQRAGYPYYFYDNRREDIYDVLNSGLLLLSKHPISNVTETFYIDEVSPTGCGVLNPVCPLLHPLDPWKCVTICKSYLDAWASKGFVQATVIKDGFQLGIFITHTQAEHHSDAKQARRRQLEQLGSQIWKYHVEN